MQLVCICIIDRLECRSIKIRVQVSFIVTCQCFFLLVDLIWIDFEINYIQCWGKMCINLIMVDIFVSFVWFKSDRIGSIRCHSLVLLQTFTLKYIIYTITSSSLKLTGKLTSYRTFKNTLKYAMSHQYAHN